MSWEEIKGHADRGARLVTQAKGIYKPRYTDFALSVRQTLDSPYADKAVVRRDDGSWVYPYFQENPDPSQRDREATNRGLMKCMGDRVPVGVLLQSKPKPGVEYNVLGLAMVREWNEGYFILEGFSDRGELHLTSDGTDAAFDRAIAATLVDFKPSDEKDTRKRRIAEIIQRRGQKKFRDELIRIYEGKCVVTGCDALEALEAAHISSYRGDHSHHPQNGLLLRADLHSLFDLGLLAINPMNMKVALSRQLLNTHYAEYHNRVIQAPRERTQRPNVDVLQEHLEWSGIAIDDGLSGASDVCPRHTQG